MFGDVDYTSSESYPPPNLVLTHLKNLKNKKVLLLENYTFIPLSWGWSPQLGSFGSLKTYSLQQGSREPFLLQHNGKLITSSPLEIIAGQK